MMEPATGPAERLCNVIAREVKGLDADDAAQVLAAIRDGKRFDELPEDLRDFWRAVVSQLLAKGGPRTAS